VYFRVSGKATRDYDTLLGIKTLTIFYHNFYIPLISFATVDGRVFTFYTELTRENYNIYKNL